MIDERSRKQIDTLHPAARPWAEAHLQAIRDSGLLPPDVEARIVSGNRTWEEQDALYAKGRTAPGSVVTKARGGQSNHNFGIAWDLGLFKDGDYLEDSPLYAKIGPVGESIGLEWGGRWKSIVDTPHYQVKTGLSTGQLRALVLRGNPVPIPEFGGSPKMKSDKVVIYDGPEKTDVPAFIKEGRVWVAVRKFVERFGGHLEGVQALGDQIKVTASLDHEEFQIDGVVREGVGFVKFADINRATDWGFMFQGDTLVVDTKEKIGL